MYIWYMMYIYMIYIWWYICIWYMILYMIYIYDIYIHTSWLIRTHHAIRLFASLGSRPQQLREERPLLTGGAKAAMFAKLVILALQFSTLHASQQGQEVLEGPRSTRFPHAKERAYVPEKVLAKPGSLGPVTGFSWHSPDGSELNIQLGWKPGKPYLRLTEHTSYSDVTHWKSFWPHWPGNCEHAGRSASCKLRGEFNRILVFFRQYCGRGLTEAFEIITSPLWFCSVEWDQAHVMGLYQNVADFAGLQRWVAFLVFEYVWRFSLFWYAALKRHFWIISDIFYHPRGNGTGSFSRERLSEGFS